MPPMKTVSYIENEAHLELDDSSPVTKKTRKLLPRPVFFRFNGKQQEARESSSSPRKEGATTGRTGEAINVDKVVTLEQPSDTENGATYSYITAPVLKATKETITGLSISQKTGNKKIIISEITKGGLFASSDLKVGDEVISINNVESDGLRVKDLGTMIAGMTGCVTVLARRQLSFVDVPETESANSSNLGSDRTPAGVAKPRKAETDKSPALLARRRQQTKVKKSPLFNNRKVAFAPSVLDVKTDKSPTMEQDATYVTIVAPVFKPTKKTKTGVCIKQGHDEKLRISDIAKGGLVDSCGLKVGDEVISINNIKTRGLLVKDVATMVREATGSVSIVVRRRLETNSKAIDAPEVVTRPIPNQESFDGVSFITEPSLLDLNDTFSTSSYDGSSCMTYDSSGTFLTPFILTVLCLR